MSSATRFKTWNPIRLTSFAWLRKTTMARISMMERLIKHFLHVSFLSRQFMSCFRRFQNIFRFIFENIIVYYLIWFSLSYGKVHLGQKSLSQKITITFIAIAVVAVIINHRRHYHHCNLLHHHQGLSSSLKHRSMIIPYNLYQHYMD